MAGRGYLHEAVDVDASHIKTLRNGRWVKMFRPINPDNLHFSAQSLYEFGGRYFEVFEKIRDPNKKFCNKDKEEVIIRSKMELL